MAGAGVARIAVNTHYLPDQVSKCAFDWSELSGTEVVISHEAQLLGTGGGVRRAWEALGRPNGPLVVMNGDGVAAFDLPALIRSHIARPYSATLLCSESGEGRVFVSGDKRTVVRVPGLDLDMDRKRDEISFCGISVLNPEAIQSLPEGFGCLLRNGLCKLVEGGRVGAAMTSGEHWDLGTPQRYWDTTRRFLAQAAHQTDTKSLPGHDFTVIPPVLIAPDCTVGSGAQVGPNVVLGGGTELSAKAVVRNSVVFGEGRVGNTVDRIVVSGATLELT